MDGSDEDLTTESETNVAEYSDKEGYSAFGQTLNEDQSSSASVEEINMTKKRSDIFQKNVQKKSNSCFRVTRM